MKAAQIREYNKKNIVVEIVEISKPKIKSKQVLVKVKTAGVNPLDNMITRGEVKLVVPYKLPLTMGNEIVGEIVELGKDIKRFKLGDRVFSRLPLDNIGGFAEYVAVDENAIAKVPDYLSDEEAASIPLTALTAMQAFELLEMMYSPNILYRSVGILLEEFKTCSNEQLNMFEDQVKKEKSERLGKAIDRIEERFGRNKIKVGFTNKDVPNKQGFMTSPTMIY